MPNEYGICEKADCFGNINYGMGNRCRALAVPYQNDCPFYKADPDGFIAKRIERDIKSYSGKVISDGRRKAI